ncbi:MAG: hypothetical protein GEV07_20545 [Streptosporangiales bacterium]|nr:hypothetical protein [Streptosporangiales bacterium]
MASRKKTTGLVLDIYARVSRVGDDRQRSTEGQVDDCKLRVAERGAVVGEVHIDSGRSAWNPNVKRPDWDRLMERLESGATGGVVVFDLERLSRRPIEGERLIAAAERGLVVLDSEGEYDLTTANGKKAFREQLVSAAYYSDRLSTKVKRGKRLKAMKGESNASWRGFGFPGKDLRTGEPVSEEQVQREREILRDRTRRLLAGESRHSMINELNKQGILTSTGGHWTQTGFDNVMLRPANAGLVTYEGEVVGRLPGEPIISEADYERVVALYALRRRGRPASDVYLCTGIVWCGRCRQRTLSGRARSHLPPYPEDGGIRRVYNCQPRPHPTNSGCGKLTVDQRALDKHVERLVIAILADPRHAASVQKAARQVASEKEKLDAEIAEIEQTTIELASRLGRGEISLARHDAAVGPLDRRLAALEEKRAALGQASAAGPISAEEINASRAEWERRWNDATTDEQRKLIRRALQGRRLFVMPADPHAPRRFDPNRIVLEDAEKSR